MAKYNVKKIIESSDSSTYDGTRPGVRKSFDDSLRSPRTALQRLQNDIRIQKITAATQERKDIAEEELARLQEESVNTTRREFSKPTLQRDGTFRSNPIKEPVYTAPVEEEKPQGWGRQFLAKLYPKDQWADAAPSTAGLESGSGLTEEAMNLMGGASKTLEGLLVTGLRKLTGKKQNAKQNVRNSLAQLIGSERRNPSELSGETLQAPRFAEEYQRTGMNPKAAELAGAATQMGVEALLTGGAGAAAKANKAAELKRLLPLIEKDQAIAARLAALKTAPKALPAPRNLGKGFRIVTPEVEAAQAQGIKEAINKAPKQLTGPELQRSPSQQSALERLKAGQKALTNPQKALPAPLQKKQLIDDPALKGETFTREPGANAQEIQRPFGKAIPIEVAPQKTVNAVGKKNPLMNQKGSLRLGKDYAGMTPEQRMAEYNRLTGKGPTVERGFVGTIKNSPTSSPELKAGVKGTYTQVTNKATLAEAQKVLAESPEVAAKIADEARPSAMSAAVNELLIDNAQKAGNYDEAIARAESLAQRMTEAGQFTQAAAIWSKLTPEGVLRYASKVVQNAVKEGSVPEAMIKKAEKFLKKSESGVSLTEEFAKKIVKQAEELQALPQGSRERLLKTGVLLRDIHELVPPTLAHKLSMAQTLAQLLNVKTAVRNVVGNAGFAGVENIKDVLATGIDKVVGKVTGQRTKLLPSLKTQWKGGIKGGAEAIEEAKLGINLNPNATQFDLPSTRVFKDGVGGELEKIMNYELRVPDRAAYQAAFEGSLETQMKIAKVAEPTTEMVAKAHADGLYRTFQDVNNVTKAFTGFKRGFNQLGAHVGFGTKEFGLGDFVIKYPKTPANILARGIDYSPVAFVDTVKEIVRATKGTGFDQAKFVESLSRGVVGTTGIGTGWWLAASGVMTGKKKEGKGQDALQEEVGLGNYKLNLSAAMRLLTSGLDAKAIKTEPNDLIVSYDWFQPQAIALAVGANIFENKGLTTSMLGQIADAVASGTNTLADQPVTQGIKRVTNYGDYAGGLADIVQGIPGSFTPTVLRQLAMMIDPTARETKDDNPLKEAVNLTAVKVPGLSKLLKPRLTPFGEEKKYKVGSGLAKLMNVAVNPAITTKYGESKYTALAAELDRVNVNVPPQALKIGNKPITKEQADQITGLAGKEVASELSRLIKRSRYTRMPEEKKKTYLEGKISSIKEAAQKKVLRHGTQNK